jgi:hypothetical protein
MPLPTPPPYWNTDEISKFIDSARGNEYATYANLKDEIHHQIDIDIAYRKAIESLNHTKEWFAGFFLLRAHSNFLAACRLSWSGQIPESYAILRSCLENSLYGLYLARNPESRETWLRRHDSDAHKKNVRNEFKIGAFLELARVLDPPEGQVATVLYDRTIDYGAHPNERALMQSMVVDEGVEMVEFKMLYLDEDSDQLRLSLKTLSQVGVCALSLFRITYRERFDISGVTAMLDHIKKGL